MQGGITKNPHMHLQYNLQQQDRLDWHLRVENYFMSNSVQLNHCTPTCLTAHAAASVVQECLTSYSFHTIEKLLWNSQYVGIEGYSILK